MTSAFEILLCFLFISIIFVVCSTVEYDDLSNENDNSDYELEPEERHGRLFPFPFFSVVRFANTECTSANTFSGTCFTRRECNTLNGTNSGTCASRRGVCCVVQRTCGSTSNVNNTYFVNPGYPTSYAGGTPCTIIINRCASDICQLRLDFLENTLAQPSGDGVCITDTFTVAGGNTVVPVLCGDNTDQTIFVDFNGDNAITITIATTASTTFSRRWNIKITQLACGCPGLAPNGCLQYYTGITNTVRSFNYGTAAAQTLSTSGVQGTRQIANLNYGICVRMEAGYCSIQWAQTADANSFTVSGDVDGADATVLGTALGALNNGACTTDFVVIAAPFDTATLANVGTDRFCGLGFVPVTSASKPFVLYVITNADEAATATASPDVANRGFTLVYTQASC